MRSLFLPGIMGKKGAFCLDNYEKAKTQAERYFLTLNQEKLLKNSPFPYDGDWVYPRFLGEDYRLNRKNGQILRKDGRPANYNEALSILDFLCHEGGPKTLAGAWAPVDSLKGRPRTLAGLGGLSNRRAERLGENLPAFRAACEALGGVGMPLGDVGYRFEVFPNFPLLLKFYAADEDFPAQITLLWDENTLDFLYYETTFYIAAALLEQIVARI